jgi:hypothetical protein
MHLSKERLCNACTEATVGMAVGFSDGQEEKSKTKEQQLTGCAPLCRDPVLPGKAPGLSQEVRSGAREGCE